MRVLTGLQPSGKLHLGNYFASIKQMLNAQENSDMFIFIANYHAMTSTSEAKTLRQNTLEAAAAFLSLGIDPDKSTFWVQSDVKEVLELYWILSQYTPMGLLERAHSYKDKTAKGISANHGLFSYPVLMAADILMYSADVVPVGKDQIQHVEIARDIALKFNNDHGDILKLPNYKVDENVATVPGVDGAKMSKSYKNTIDIFSDAKGLKKQISQIVTSSEPLEAPKDWKNCNIYNIAKLFLDENGQKDLQARYERGGEGHGHFKMYLNELVWDYFADAREKFDYYINNTNEIEKILENGAKKAKDVALPLIEKVRQTTGIY
ncbi:tryptophanyl-tRNA synthetase [Campylobacter pinnipediorum subsp. caledonicus]|uniref:Tryptophan--tRNA ligase n=1 Tax=Campylobacter pinnipediorum subsp. caledonicus TaxID=1874362 RepID=A0A1S6U5E7_9BACT|nr:tryptophan--tRNA ligase [Campylobacter pinnipediorum]AQW85324.1 tryptophanyl-tRNA synthetase [Campylobacter pinnipediorum subsp. caledonicus]AQW86933.1 tryptophanyl-tRNA synthetase [Campylobacter pinnipediorum subsp. caledonicus]